MASAACNVLAGGTFVAWLSYTGAPAGALLAADGEWYTLDGRRIGTRAEILSGTLGAAINVDSVQNTNPAKIAWTGTYPDGAAATDNCGNWSKMGDGGTGTTDALDGGWTASGVESCTLNHAVYCFEQ